MKEFIRNIGKGFIAICLSAMSVFGIVGSIIVFASIHTYIGWEALGAFIVALLGFAMGVLFMCILGSYMTDDKKE